MIFSFIFIYCSLDKHYSLQKAKLGLVLGVYLPTIQHIFGVILFVRLAWIVGCAGFVESFICVAMCCVCVSYLLSKPILYTFLLD